MSLQVWLPLDGSLENRGCSQVSVINSGATVSDIGKIGKCYSFNGTSNYLSLSQGPFLNQKEFSYSCWINLTSDALNQCLYSQRTGVGLGIAIFLISGYVRFDDGGNLWESGVKINTNNWTHFCATRDENSKKIYINGELVSESLTIGDLSNIGIKATIGGSESSDTGNATDNWVNGKLNDVRLYDHALTIKEIKDLAKGLCLHYKLSRDAAPNQARNTSTSWSTPFTGFSGIQNTCPTVATVETAGLQVGDIVNVYLEYKYQNIVPADGQTASCWMQGAGNVTAWNSGTFGSTPNFDLSGSGTHIFNYTFTMTADRLQNETWSVNIRHDYVQSGSVSWRLFKVEKGSSPTPWVPNRGDANYTNFEQDASGYGRKGTCYGNLTISEKTPKYKNSLSFNSSGYIVGPYPNTIKPESITLACWAKINTLISQEICLIACYEAGGAGISITEGKAMIEIYSSTYLKAINPTIIADARWHHYAGTYDKTTNRLKLYVDGQVVADIVGGPISYNATTPWAVNANPGPTGAAGGPYLNGNISDVRVYATALSDADIKELATPSIKLDKQNIFAGEFVETGRTLVECQYDKTVYTEPDGSKWMRVVHHNSPSTAGLFAQTDNFSRGAWKDANRWFDGIALAQFDSCELLIKQKATSDANEYKYRWKQNKSPMTATYDDVAPGLVIPNTTSGYSWSDGVGGLWRRDYNNNTFLCQYQATRTNWHSAFGCWILWSSDGIPGYNSDHITTGYLDLYVRIDGYNTENPDIDMNKRTILTANTFVEQDLEMIDSRLTPYKNSSAYNCAQYYLKRPLEVGKEYLVTMYATATSEKAWIDIYIGGGSYRIPAKQIIKGTRSPFFEIESDGLYQFIFEANQSGVDYSLNKNINIYCSNIAGAGQGSTAVTGTCMVHSLSIKEIQKEDTTFDPIKIQTKQFIEY